MTKIVVTKDMVPSEDSAGWYLHSDDGVTRIWRYDREEGGFFQRKETVAEDTLIRFNQEQKDQSKGKRIGEWLHVGRVPLHVLYSPESQIAQKMTEGDKDHLKWFLNSETGKPYSTWWGKL